MTTHITVNDAANALGVTGQRVRQMIREGKLKASRIGQRTFVIDARSLKALTEKRQETGAKE